MAKKHEVKKEEKKCEHFDDKGFPLFYPIGISEGICYVDEAWLVVKCDEGMGGCGKKWAVPFTEFD